MVNNELLDSIKTYYKARKNSEPIVSENGDILAYKYLKKEAHGVYTWDYISFNKEYESIINSRIQKSSRIQKHIVYGLTHYKYAWFGTFTFNNEFLEKSDRTQRDAIKKVLKRLKIEYILNVDFGDLKERKHFHCIMFLDFNLKDFTTLKQVKSKGTLKWLWCDLVGYDAGFSSFEPIGTTTNDINKLKKYINKLSNHCQKDSTESTRVVYSFKAYEINYFRLDYGISGKTLHGSDKKFMSHYNTVHNNANYLRDKELLGFELK